MGGGGEKLLNSKAVSHCDFSYKKKQWRPPSKKKKLGKKSKPEEEEGKAVIYPSQSFI
jgi:hypothetical protein